MTFWVTLDKPVRYRGADRQSMSVEAKNRGAAEEKILAAFPGRSIASIATLPYPAEPRFDYKSNECPSFCLHPVKCAGQGSCPRNISCSE